ncbi:MAG: glycosyl transferase family 2 [Candidatus Brocadiaceae bacterium]|nr:glycosyl transferase family 2 [Candidatus Brocadiaceae bacterium]
MITMNVSVIIPAHNAVDTLSETLESLLAQTHGQWEAIVVNDGSTDKTDAIVTNYSQKDSRIHSIWQPQGGEASARNTGINLANYDWLLFLDADDWIASSYLEKMTNTLAADPSLDAVHCGWARVLPHGKLGAENYCPQSENMFDLFACYCAFAIHACVVRRTLVKAVGGFDTSLRTCPDWDLWQRIARTGTRFGAVHEVLAFYRMRQNSASINGYQILTDGLRVITRGHAPDQRVPLSDPLYVNGMPFENITAARFYFSCWAAGLVIGRGEDARPLLAAIKDDREPALNPNHIARHIFGAVLHSAAELPEAWIELWPGLKQRIEEFLVALEDQSKTPGLNRRASMILIRMIIENSSAPKPITVGTVHVILVDVTKPITDVSVPAGIERLYCIIELEKSKLGTIELPVCDTIVSRYVLMDAIAARFAWSIIGKFFETTVYKKLTEKNMHDSIGWNTFLQEIWGCPNLSQNYFHQTDVRTSNKNKWQSILKTIRSSLRKPGNYFFESAPVLKRGLNGNWIIIEVSEDIVDMRVSGKEINILLTVGGVAIGALTISVKDNIIRASELRAALTDASGYELCCAAVREGLLGRPITEKMSLRERLANSAANVRQHTQSDDAINVPVNINPAPNYVHAISQALLPSQHGMVFGRHTQGTIGTSVSRRAILPSAAINDLITAASVTGEPVFQTSESSKNPVYAVYAPDLAWLPLIEKQESTPSAMANKTVSLPNGKTSRKNCNKTDTITNKLPILMYHRISPTGASATARYRVTPESFEEQIKYLYEAGFYSAGLDDWFTAMRTKNPLPGRAILITFDDGYQDFLTFAWPVLKRYGFSAIVFIVTDEIGGINRWDNAYGEQIPLLGWTDIHLLYREGVEFGSHTTSHPYLTALSASEVVREGACSRAVLWRELGVPIKAFAYPHGAEDEVVQHLIGACGYIYGLSCRWGLSTYHDSPLALPRLEVFGSDNLQNFIAKLNIH